jgi:fucose permease
MSREANREPEEATRTILPTAGAFLALLVFALSANMLPAALLRASSDLGVTPQALAILSAVQFAVFCPSAAASGVLADRWGMKRVFVVAGALMAAGAWVWAGAHRMAHAGVAAALWGGAGGILETLSAALLCELFPLRRKFFMNASQVFYTAGAIAGPWIAGWCLPRGTDWRLLFLGVGLTGLGLGGLFLACRLPAPPPQERLALRQLLPEVRAPGFLSCCAALFLYVLAESAVGTFANLYLRRDRGAPESWAIYSIAIFWAAMMAGRALCALLPERASYERTLGAILGLSGIALALQGLASAWQASLALFALAGFVFSGSWPLIVALISSRAPRHSASLVGLAVAAGSLGCVAAPPLMNALMALVPLRSALAAMSVPLLVAAGCAAWRPAKLAGEPPCGAAACGARA